jgi:hypothetical protein
MSREPLTREEVEQLAKLSGWTLQVEGRFPVWERRIGADTKVLSEQQMRSHLSVVRPDILRSILAQYSDWTPSAEAIDALPDGVRDYIGQLLARLESVKDRIEGLEPQVDDLEKRIHHLRQAS